MERVTQLRGEGRWPEALEVAGDPLLRADLLNEQALFAADAEARAAAGRELDRAEALVALGRGRILHADFLETRERNAHELALFERALALATAAEDPLLEGWARLWIGLFHQVVDGDGGAARPFFEAAYAAGEAHGDRVLMSHATRHLAWEDEEAGNLDGSWARWEESVELRRVEGFLPGVAAGLLTLGEAAAERGRPDDARRLLTEARELAERSNARAFLVRIDAVLADL
jgi:tetratricopeptide (TPR) repeat protein